MDPWTSKILPLTEQKFVTVANKINNLKESSILISQFFVVVHVLTSCVLIKSIYLRWYKSFYYQYKGKVTNICQEQLSSKKCILLQNLTILILFDLILLYNNNFCVMKLRPNNVKSMMKKQSNYISLSSVCDWVM